MREYVSLSFIGSKGNCRSVTVRKEARRIDTKVAKLVKFLITDVFKDPFFCRVQCQAGFSGWRSQFRWHIWIFESSKKRRCIQIWLRRLITGITHAYERGVVDKLSDTSQYMAGARALTASVSENLMPEYKGDYDIIFPYLR